ncbi:MAG TPA: hypothetical protein VM223_08170 [Planctomycetota bacterium]|nr:hypothetical protein [Planctomycetota bacterium]
MNRSLLALLCGALLVCIAVLSAVWIIDRRANAAAIRRNMPLSDFVALRSSVYVELGNALQRCPPGTCIQNPTIARVPKAFPDNDFVARAAKHQTVQYYNRGRWTLALDDALVAAQTEETKSNIAKQISAFYTQGLGLLGLKMLGGSGGHHMTQSTGTEKRSHEIWTSPDGHVVVIIDVRAYLEARYAEVNVVVLELY